MTATFASVRQHLVDAAVCPEDPDLITHAIKQFDELQASMVALTPLLDEAALVLQNWTTKPDVDEYPAGFRWPLMDELSGTAAILRETQAPPR